MPPAAEPYALRLSARETQILRLTARGRLDKEMAVDMGVSIGTVRTYRKRLQAKLGTRGPAPTVIVAHRLGLIDLDLIGEELMALAEERLSRTRGG